MTTFACGISPDIRLSEDDPMINVKASSNSYTLSGGNDTLKHCLFSDELNDSILGIPM